MKLIKILGLVAIAALAATAVIGVSSASAEVKLCKVEEEECSEANEWPMSTKFEGSSEEAVLTGLEPAQTIKCKSATTVTGSEEASTETLLLGRVTALTFTNCNESCTVKVEGLPYKAHLKLDKGLPNAKPLDGDLIVLNPKTLVTCAFGFVKCKVGAGEVALLIDEKTALVLAKEVLLTLEKSEGFAECPKTAHWNANYTKTAPAGNVYVTM